MDTETTDQSEGSLVIYIYALTDPRTDQVRYVGKANNPIVRYRNHCTGRDDGNRHKGNWVRQLRRDGLKPGMRILEEVTEGTWEEREQHWITHFRHAGAPLTNLREGGYGPVHFTVTEEFRKKMREVNQEINSRPYVKAKHTENTRRLWQDPEHRKKMQVAYLGLPSRSRESRERSSQALKEAQVRYRESHDGRSFGRLGRAWDGFVTPDGEKCPPIVNLAEFCRQRGLGRTGMEKVWNGQILSHRGWTCCRAEIEEAKPKPRNLPVMVPCNQCGVPLLRHQCKLLRSGGLAFCNKAHATAYRHAQAALKRQGCTPAHL